MKLTYKGKPIVFARTEQRAELFQGLIFGTLSLVFTAGLWLAKHGMPF